MYPWIEPGIAQVNKYIHAHKDESVEKHQVLDNDDIAGIEGLYGVASAPQPAPDVPGNNAPPPTTGEDQDQDGIADQDELLVTGTDPNNPDSDNDGLGDGVEVERDRGS